MKLLILICSTLFVAILGKSANHASAQQSMMQDQRMQSGNGTPPPESRELMVLPPHPRMRHSRHLEGFVPIHTTSASAVAKLAVKDNHKPIFTDCSNYKPSVKEEASPGTYVFTIKATDVDPPETGGTVTYKFVTTPGEKERFHLEPHSGKIFTADIFDHDEPSREKDTYVTVRVTDNGQPSLDDACTIKITIEDINDNQPVFDKVSYAESVPADLQVGREVMRISATDIDDGNNSVVHYSLDPSSPDASYFSIDPDNGVIFLKKPIEKSPGYKFRLSAIVKDMGEPPQQSSITLDVTVIESNKKSPSFIEVPNDVIRLKENYNDFLNPIATVRATSNTPDEEKVQFELVQGQTEQTNKLHTFILEPDGDTAYVKLGNLLDYEKITEYTLTIRIQNNFHLAAETIINIEVEDVNDNIPVFSEIRSGTVSENEPTGTPVMQVRAIDLDGTAANNQVTYKLADPTDPFTIDPITGNITTNVIFDREDKSFYNIKIIAIDNSESAMIKGKHNIGQQTFLIEIADKNDNPPHFTQDTYIAESIAENANINELVTQVTARDVDTASIVTYSIVSGNTFESFTIRNFTGEIRVNKQLDYENMTEFSLDVRAYDGKYEDFAKVVIRIENLNDNPPIFLDNYTKTIEEERLYEGCIVKLEAYDPDIRDRNAPQNIVYSLVKHEQKEFLEIDNDGCLRLTKPLDRDQPSGFIRWQILIMAADHGGRLGSDSLRSTTEVILELTDINDNAPFLTNTQPVVWYENEPTGQVVVLTAKDNDSPKNGAPFTFALNDSASFDLKSKFKIQGNALYAITSFDREDTKEYFVPILITDSGSPRMTGLSILHVIIGDKNDNPMAPGFSSVFVYNYKGDSPDTEVGRVYVEDPDDWDLKDKKFTWLPSYELKSPYFDVNSQTGMITMKQGTPNGNYSLQFNVTEQNEPLVPFHWVEATVNVTIKEIPEEAVDKSGSVRFVNITAEQFIVPELDGTSKKEKFHRRLAKLFNVTLDNVDVFTVSNKRTVKDSFLDIRFSAHGSPYYSPEKLNTMVTGIQDFLEDELSLKIYMVNIDECLIEREQCEDSCRNVLIKNNVPLAVYTNSTSFIGVSARVESECTCEVGEQLICLNGGTPFADKCECPEGYLGPRCEQTSIGFHGDGWAMYPPPPACHEGHITLTVVAHSSNSLVFYMGPLKKNSLLPIEDFMSLELVDGYPVLLVNHGSGTTRLNNSVVYVADGKPHLIEIILMRISIEMFVDRCKLTTCMSLAAPTGTKEILNINGPLQVGGANVDLKSLSKDFNWRYSPADTPFVGCIHNFTYNEFMYNLGEPSYHKNADPSCQRSMFTAVTFGIDTSFLVALLVCAAVLIILLLAVVVHRRRQDTWAEKELDDIRENIIAYEDEGGGEGDAGYDLHVLRQMFAPLRPDLNSDNWQQIKFMRYFPFDKLHGQTRCGGPVCIVGICDQRYFAARLADSAAAAKMISLLATANITTVGTGADENPPVSSTISTIATVPSPTVTTVSLPSPEVQNLPPARVIVTTAIINEAPRIRTAKIVPPRCARRARPVIEEIEMDEIRPAEPEDEDTKTTASTVASRCARRASPIIEEIEMDEIRPANQETEETRTTANTVASRCSQRDIPVIVQIEINETRPVKKEAEETKTTANTVESRRDRRASPVIVEIEMDEIRPAKKEVEETKTTVNTVALRRDRCASPAIVEIEMDEIRPAKKGVEETKTTANTVASRRDRHASPVIVEIEMDEIRPAKKEVEETRTANIVAPRCVRRGRPVIEEIEMDEIRRADPDAEESGSLRVPEPPRVPITARPGSSKEGSITSNPKRGVAAAAPDISGFLDDKKEVVDRDPDGFNPFDDVRHYAYEGDGDTSGSLSSLASCTDDNDQNFTYLQEYGPPFSKLADLYGDLKDDDSDSQMSPKAVPAQSHRSEESWC